MYYETRMQLVKVNNFLTQHAPGGGEKRWEAVAIDAVMLRLQDDQKFFIDIFRKKPRLGFGEIR